MEGLSSTPCQVLIGVIILTTTINIVVHRCSRGGLISFKVALQGLTAQSTMEAEVVAAALTMKEAVFCKGMIQAL